MSHHPGPLAPYPKQGIACASWLTYAGVGAVILVVLLGCVVDQGIWVIGGPALAGLRWSLKWAWLILIVTGIIVLLGTLMGALEWGEIPSKWGFIAAAVLVVLGAIMFPIGLGALVALAPLDVPHPLSR